MVMSHFPICTTLLHGFRKANRKADKSKKGAEMRLFCCFYAVFVFFLNKYDILHVDLFCKRKEVKHKCTKQNRKNRK
jgi:hypothetical protein